MTRTAMLCICLLVGLGQAAKLVSKTATTMRESELEQAWARELDHKKVSPIRRVVKLLLDMKKQLEDEGGRESEMYDEMICWCETNTKEKTQAIADAEAKTGELEAGIQEKAARKAEFATEIDKLKKEIPGAEESLQTARAIREKEQAAFSDVETEMVQATQNLKNAISILGRHQGGEAALLQLDNPLGATIQEVLRDVALKYAMLMSRTSSRKSASAFIDITGTKALHKQLITALGGSEVQGVLPLDIAERKLADSVQTPKLAAAFMQASQPVFNSYNARSDKIFGILSQMLEEFETSLSQHQEEEKAAEASHEKLEGSQTSFIEASKEKLDELETEHASMSKALSDDKEDLDLTRKQRSADMELLRTLKLQCQDLDSQWEKRSKTRATELTAVSEALSILTADDAKDLFAKSAPSFLQELTSSSASESIRRSRVVTALRKAAANAADPLGDDSFLSSLADSWRSRYGSSVARVVSPKSQLSTLAVTAQLDSFTKVKEMMEKMVADLKKEQQEEAKEKSFCVKELDENEKVTYEKDQEKEDLEAEIAGLTATVKTLAKEIDVATKEVADTQEAMKKASEDRERENAEFQTTVSEQRATQEILKKALTRLGAFYKKKALLQQSQEPVSPVQFNAYKKNAGASPAMSLLEQIISDSATLEAEVTKGEKEGQAAYETFIKDSNALIAELTVAITEKKKSKATVEGDMESAKASHTEAVGELESLAEYKADMHTRCDWLQKNFDIRQTARLQEIEAIHHAKGILSGSAQSAQ